MWVASNVAALKVGKIAGMRYGFKKMVLASTLFAHVAACITLAICGVAQAQQYQGVAPDDGRKPGRWRLFRNSIEDMPPVLVASFDYRNVDGGYDSDYNQSECDIILGLVRDDNDKRPMHLDYWCIEG